MSNDSELIDDFLIESFEGLSSISDELTTLERNPDDDELINSIYRKIHTLKGSAGFLGFSSLQKVTHSLENVLSLIRDKSIILNATLMDMFLKYFDICTAIVKNIEETGEEGKADVNKVVADIISSTEVSVLQNELMIEEKFFLDEQENTSNILNSQELKIQKLQSSSSSKVKTNKEAKKIPKAVETKKSLSQTSEVKMKTSEDQKKTETLKTEKVKTDSNVKKKVEKPKSAKKSVSDSIVKVNVTLLDNVMNIVGELVLNRNQIIQRSSELDDGQLSKLAIQLDSITSELQTGIMEMRMQPVGSVFSKFERTIRDLARSQNKPIRLEIVGKETELDKTLLEAIKDPMTHMIRNSVDHGIETIEERKLTDKNEEGRIRIKAYHEGGQVIVEVSDDGKGIDPKVIASIAVKKGVVSSEEIATWTDKKIINLIFNAGFSTAEKVTNISGRGVGMDVVRSNIEKIGGEVDLTSVVGQGSVFRLKIPLTLAIVPALIVECRQNKFAIHQKNLVELVLLEEDDTNKRIERIDDQEFFRLRGDLIPLFRLEDKLKLEGERSKATGFEDNNSLNVVVMHADGNIYGLIVDRVLDTQEIVVKPLSKKLKNLSFYAGSTIMGDGKVALIIDAFGFYNFIEGGQAQKHDSEGNNDNLSDNYVNIEEQEYLIVRLGDQRGYAIPLCLITRLEEFKGDRINFSGELALIKYGDNPMSLINLEKMLKIKGKSKLESFKAETIIPTIVFSLRGYTIALVVDEILDIGVTGSEVNLDTIDRDGLWGTVYINDILYPVIDIHRIVEMHPIGKNIFVDTKKEKRNKTVLLAEDSPIFQKVMKELLTEEGFDVVVCQDGQFAWEYLEKSSVDKIDLVLTDIEMPRMNGFQLAKKIRESDKWKNIPIIAVTTRVNDKDIAIGKEVGINVHLEKLNKEDVANNVNVFF